MFVFWKRKPEILTQFLFCFNSYSIIFFFHKKNEEINRKNIQSFRSWIWERWSSLNLFCLRLARPVVFVIVFTLLVSIVSIEWCVCYIVKICVLKWEWVFKNRKKIKNLQIKTTPHLVLFVYINQETEKKHHNDKL